MNIWSLKTDGLLWQWSLKTGFTVLFFWGGETTVNKIKLYHLNILHNAQLDLNTYMYVCSFQVWGLLRKLAFN